MRNSALIIAAFLFRAAQAPSPTSRAAASAVVALVSSALSREAAVAAGAVARVLSISACSTLGAGDNWAFPALLCTLVGAMAPLVDDTAAGLLMLAIKSCSLIRHPLATPLAACPQGAAAALSDEQRLARFLATVVSEHGAQHLMPFASDTARREPGIDR